MTTRTLVDVNIANQKVMLTHGSTQEDGTNVGYEDAHRSYPSSVFASRGGNSEGLQHERRSSHHRRVDCFLLFHEAGQDFSTGGAFSSVGFDRGASIDSQGLKQSKYLAWWYIH